MKLGLGLYRHMLTPDNFRFAKQAGATHIVAHYVDYFKGGALSSREDQPTGSRQGWGMAGDPDAIWSFEELDELRKNVESEGLILEALENFDPAHWHDILLDGPKKQLQMTHIKSLIRNVGRAGIPVFGYNFSLAGVAVLVKGPFARWGAESVGMNGPEDTPIPNGMVWNMIYDGNAPAGDLAPVNHAELWDRLRYFLEEILPVADEAGVKMAAHPDDPPCEFVRGQPRLVYQPQLYQKLLDLVPNAANTLEFCIGSLAEMTEGDIYETVDTYSSQDKIGYIHFRNVRGTVPTYKETFIDEGDVDMIRVLKILKKNQYSGVLIPDHTPQMTCDAPWHAGMAYALGYLKAALRLMDE